MIKGKSEYLGVQFLYGEIVDLGESTLAMVQCIYDCVDYSGLTDGSTFFIMEGSNKVGEGIVVERLVI